MRRKHKPLDDYPAEEQVREAARRMKHDLDVIIVCGWIMVCCGIIKLVMLFFELIASLQ